MRPRLAAPALALTLALLASCSSSDGDEPGDEPAKVACNGSLALCDRRYDQVAYLGTHNSYSYAEGGPVTYSFPNQDRPVPDQLARGVRAFGIRPCPYQGGDEAEEGKVYTTHNCKLKGALGQEPLSNVLGQIKLFLDGNRGEVITLLSESDVSPGELAAVFDQAGLAPYLYTHDPARGFLTLGEMVASGRRLVVFNDSKDPSRPAWQHFMWDYLVDTDYNITDKAQFSCAFYRGDGKNPLYFLNEFIYKDIGSGIVVPDKQNAQLANDRAFIVERARQCRVETGRFASFVYVDWFGQGDPKGAVDEINSAPP